MLPFLIPNLSYQITFKSLLHPVYTVAPLPSQVSNGCDPVDAFHWLSSMLWVLQSFDTGNSKSIRPVEILCHLSPDVLFWVPRAGCREYCTLDSLVEIRDRPKMDFTFSGENENGPKIKFHFRPETKTKTATYFRPKTKTKLSSSSNNMRQSNVS